MSKSRDTEFFHYYNANPKNKKTTDCVIRAISTLPGMEYNQVYSDLVELSLQTGYHIADVRLYDKYLTKLGYTKQKRPTKPNGKFVRAREICELYPDLIAVANVGTNHVSCFKFGRIWDTWNCQNSYVGNLWTRGEIDI